MSKLIILAAPSGAGKSTIAKFLLEKNSHFCFSISATTRAPRGKEKNGEDYYFLSIKDFQQKIENNEFVEWEMVYADKYYGTLHSELQRIWKNNKVPILDIDVQGAMRVKQNLQQDCLTIFIQPPSIEELKKRLIERNTDSLENIQIRLDKAAYEISFKENFDVIVVNDDLSVACQKVNTAIEQYLAR